MRRQHRIAISPNKKSRIRSAFLVALLAFVAVGVAMGVGIAGTTPVAMAPATEEAKAESSTVLNLEAYKGKVVYVDFWASWCVPCRKSFPWLNAMHAKYKKDGLVVIGVNVDRNEKAAQKFLKKMPADFDIVYDPKGQLAGQYKLEAMPSSFLYSRDGTLHESHEGFRDDDRDPLEKAIKTLLQEKTTDAKKAN